MNEAIPLTTFVGFLLALVRTASWMAVAPPFNTRMVPKLVKLGMAAGISLVLAPKLPADKLTLDTGALLGLVLMQALTGVALGFITLMLFNAVQAAGSLIDLFGGFTMSQALDPFLNNQSSTFGRFYQLMATVLLFAINGHLMLVKGFMKSFDAVPLGGIRLDSYKDLLLKDFATFAVSAIEIAGPLLAAFFLAEIALGLLGKAAPQLNLVTFGPPFKILLTLLMVASALPLIPGALHELTNQSIFDGLNLLKRK